jgi:hypothetical protein
MVWERIFDVIILIWKIKKIICSFLTVEESMQLIASSYNMVAAII